MSASDLVHAYLAAMEARDLAAAGSFSVEARAKLTTTAAQR